jgi:hypothetical protein
MSVRTYIATAAMQGILSNPNMLRSVFEEANLEKRSGAPDLAKLSCLYADAVIAELNKPDPQ